VTAKDDNKRLLEGTLPADPEDDAEALHVEAPPSVFGDRWKTLAAHGGIEWFDIAPPRRRWLLELPGDNAQTGERTTGILPLGKVGMLAAAGAAGKTMALLQLALAVATGRDWLDTYTTPNPGYVLLALGEEDLEEVRRRIYAAGRLMRLTDEQRRIAAERIIVLPLAGTRLSLTDEHGLPTAVQVELQARLQSSSNEWRLIVLDPLSRFAGLDAEVDNHAATAFVETLEILAQTRGTPTLLVAHHTTKASRGADGDASAATAARGASALTDGVRWVANLEPDRALPDRVRLTITKSNYSQRVPPINLVRCEGGALRGETANEREQREQKAKEQRDQRQTSQGPRSAVTHEDY
jgi:RecA-family ATPase